eukprot:1153968-Pelagomonas_calceolata.AAC.2
MVYQPVLMMERSHHGYGHWALPPPHRHKGSILSPPPSPEMPREALSATPRITLYPCGRQCGRPGRQGKTHYQQREACKWEAEGCTCGDTSSQSGEESRSPITVEIGTRMAGNCSFIAQILLMLRHQ